MARPRFSIVIPTRMRHATLPFTLKTCLAQCFSDFEIVVADNASTPATRAVVEACQSERIRYIRSEESLPMTANWTRAVEHAQGEWILMLGDDDALFPWSLAELDNLVSRHRTLSVRWEFATYTWPCVGTEDQRNRLQLPLGSHVRLASAKRRLAKMRRRPQAVTVPLPYHGLIHRSLFERALETGPIFEGPCPDTFAGIFMASLEPRFLEVGMPMSLIGISGKSNGLQGVIQDGKGATYRDFVALNEQANIRFHPQLPQLATAMPVIILDGLLRAHDRLTAKDGPPVMGPLQIASHCLDGLWQTGEERQFMLDEIERILPTPDACSAFRRDARYATPKGSRPSAVSPLGMHRRHVVLDTTQLQIADVATASQAASDLLRGTSWSPGRFASSKQKSHSLKRLLASQGYDLSTLELSWQQRLATWSHRKLRSLRKRIPQIGRRAA